MLEVVTGGGHEIQTDQPQRVVDAIGWVMKQLDQSVTGEEVRSGAVGAEDRQYGGPLLHGHGVRQGERV